MKKKFTMRHRGTRMWSTVTVVFLTTLVHTVVAQVSSLPANKPVPYFSGTSIVSAMTSAEPSLIPLSLSGVLDAANVINIDPSKYATIRTFLTDGNNGKRLTVDVGETVIASPSAPFFVGFDISSADLLSLDLLGLTGNSYYRINLYDNNDLVTSLEYDKASIMGLFSSSLITGISKIRVGGTVGLEEEVTFNRVMFQKVFSGVSLTDTYVYNLVLGRYETANYASLACNANVGMQAPDYPMHVVRDRTSSQGVVDPLAALDDDPATTTALGGLSTVLSGGIGYSVADVYGSQMNTADTKAFVGFDVENSHLLGLLDVGILANYTVRLYNDGAPVQSYTGGDLLTTNLTLLGGTGRTVIGVITDKTFDEVQLVVGESLTVSATPTKVHGLVLKRFCVPSSALVCNELEKISTPNHPLYINSLRTGTGGVLNLGSLSNTENIINGAGTAATVSTVAAVAGAVSVAVANALETYPAGSFAGFDVASESLLQASMLGNSGISIEVYNSASPTPNTPVYTSSASLLAGVGALSGENRAIIGIVSPVPFNEVRLVIAQTVGANVGDYKIHGLHVQKACDQAVDCSFGGMLSQSVHGAVINADRTGVTLGVSATLGDVAMDNPWNAVSASGSDHATMNTLASLVSTTSLSVAATAYTFPAGTFAGFEVTQGGGLIDLGLFNDSKIQIVTYNNGSQVDMAQSAGDGLLNLSLLSSSSGRSVIGFFSTQPFDEIQIKLIGSVSVNIGYALEVYGAVVSTRYIYEPGTMECALQYIRPDQNTGYINTLIPGNTATNDLLPPGSTYSLSGSPSLPDGAVPTFDIESNGQYDFETSTPGLYTYQVQVCIGGVPSACPIIPLKIHVLDLQSINLPVGYQDFAAVEEGSSNNIIRVKINDIPGNAGGTLGMPTVISGPGNGTVAFNGAGEAVYTPNAGFYGRDQFTYEVCETPGNRCTAPVQVLVFVKQLGGDNLTLAVDDQMVGSMNENVEGNVLANDFDPEGHAQEIAMLDLDGDGVPETLPSGGAQDVLQNGTKVGTITVNASSGNVVFSPEPTFKGTVNMAIQVRDSEGATSNATLVLVIADIRPDLMVRMTAGPTIIVGTTSIQVVVQVLEVGGVETEGPIAVLIPKNSSMEIAFNTGTGTMMGIAFDNTNWTFTDIGSYWKWETSSALAPRSVLRFGFTVQYAPGTSSGTITPTLTIQAGSGGETNSFNNSDAERIDYSH